MLLVMMLKLMILTYTDTVSIDNNYHSHTCCRDDNYFFFFFHVVCIGAAEGLTFLTVLGGLVIAALNYVQYGYVTSLN